jgi:hypothetical protein
MPHATTKNKRIKRVDTRPNEKTRRKAHKTHNDSLKIQDIRVTRKLKEEKKERTFQEAASSFSTLSKDEKVLRALKKKLKGINDLLEKKKKGEVLNEQQKTKVSQLDNVLEDMEVLLKKTKHITENDDDEEGEDDEDEDNEEMEAEEEED